MRCNLKRIGAAVALTMLVCFSTAHAQDAFEDEKGDSSIFLKDGGGFAHVNVSDTSVKLGHIFERTDKNYFFGFEVTGKLSGDFASLFESHKPSPEAKFNAFIGRKFLFSKKPNDQPTKGPLTDDWLTFRMGYRRARYKLLDEGNTFANQVRKQSFDGFSAIVAYNAQFKSKSDFVWFPAQFKSQIGLNFFTRSNVGQGDKNFEPGVGLFFSKEGAPTRVIGGISISLRDGKARVGLVAGYNF
ncbi:MAG: hypothetical protein DMF67_16550 [Acidobacteria bacterium]|nr:MAG: hypothetical protein DMF67_16550 [Acidobacteriota bacterium]